MRALIVVAAALLQACPAPAPRPTTPTPPPITEEEEAPQPPPAPAREVLVRATSDGAEIVVGEWSHPLVFERATAWSVPLPEGAGELPVRLEGALVLLSAGGVARGERGGRADAVEFVARAPSAAGVGGAECVGACDALLRHAREAPSDAPVVYVRAPELPSGVQVGARWIVDGGAAEEADALTWRSARLEGPRWWARARARYDLLIEHVRSVEDGDPVAELVTALTDRYEQHRRNPHPVAAGQDPDGEVLVAFCADVGGELTDTPPTEGRFRGVLEFDGCLRRVGMRLLAIRGPALDARMRRRLLGGATAEGTPPVVVRSPGPLRPGDRLVRLHRTELRTLADLDLAAATVERRQRVLLRYLRNGQTRRQWITMPRLESDDEFVRFVIERGRWRGPPALINR